MAARVGTADIDIRGFRNIAIAVEVLHGREIAALGGPKDVGAVAAEELRRALEEQALRGGKDAADGEPRVVDAVLAAHQILRHQRTVRPGQDVVVHGVYPAKRRAHLSHLELESPRQAGEREVALFERYSLLAKRDKHVAARVGVDDGL